MAVDDRRGRSRRVLFGSAVVAAMVVGLVVFALTRGGEPSDREYFQQHRSDFDRVQAMVASGRLEPGGSPNEKYYGPLLPAGLRQLSVTRRVTIQSDGRLFIPRWTGIPDDAGGYWYSRRSPEGEDMYGLVCSKPVALGHNWWACMMRD